MLEERAFDGDFAVWSFTIGHGRLLLRRTKSNEHSTRVDILLKDVGWMSVPTNFTNVRICEVPREQVQEMLSSSGAREDGRKVFALVGANSRGYVLAAAVAFHEDDGEYDDPSALLE